MREAGDAYLTSDDERSGEGGTEAKAERGVADGHGDLQGGIPGQHPRHGHTSSSRDRRDRMQSDPPAAPSRVNEGRVKARIDPQPRREETCNYCLEVFYPTEKFFEKHAWCCYKCHRAQKRMCRFMGADYDSD